MLFPSKDQRDWSKFKVEKPNRPKFDPKTLQPFDKVLARISNESYTTWSADFVAEPSHAKNETPLTLGVIEANMVIPYNEETKHLVGTEEEALFRHASQIIGGKTITLLTQGKCADQFIVIGGIMACISLQMPIERGVGASYGMLHRYQLCRGQ